MKHMKHYFAILIDYNLWGESCVSFYSIYIYIYYIVIVCIDMSIRDSGLGHLIRHMKHLRNIKILDLASNKITNDGISDLAERITELRNLKQLCLQCIYLVITLFLGNDFNDAQYIDKMLKVCTNLTITVSKDSFDFFSIEAMKLKWDKRLDLDNIDVIR